MPSRRYTPSRGRYTVSPVLLPHVKHREGDLDLVDRMLEPQTISSFLSFTCYGTLPNGRKTIYPLLNAETDFPLLYIDNYDGAQSTSTSESTSTPWSKDNRSIIRRVMARIGSKEAPDDDRIALITRHIYSFKHLAWNGMIPLSEQRWKEKKLDERENFDVATQYLSAVCAAFLYLNFETVREDLRETFNLISVHWGEFDTLINASQRERGMGGPIEVVNVRAMWTEYIESLYETMTSRAHRWVLLHVNALRRQILDELSSHEPIDINTHDQFQLKLLNQLHTLTEIMGVADYTISMPMQGYWGYNTPPKPLGRGVPSALRSSDQQDRHRAYGGYMKKVTRETQMQEIRDARLRGGLRERGDAAPEALHRLSMLQIRCQDRVRREIRGVEIERVPREPWVLDAARAVGLSEEWEEGDDENEDEEGEEPRGSGFVIYRLTYGQSEDEWDAFVKRLEAHMGDWGRGQTGSSVLKPYLKLHWRDGRELGITEGDIDAAKEHYRDTYNQDNDTPFNADNGVNEHAFLAVDKASYDSYITTKHTYKYDTFFGSIPPGNTTGFVLAVDPEYDLEEGPEREDEIPGFLGHLRILGSLIWGDLYAMLVSQSTLLEDMWPLAIDHPDYVYTGPVVPLVQDAWKMHNGIRGAIMREVCSFVKAKVDGREYVPRPWPSSPSRQSHRQPHRTTNPTTNPSTSATAQPSSSTAADEPSLFDDLDLEPGPELSSVNAAMRTYMLSEYARYLRQRGQYRRAIFAEELMRTPRGERPDMDAVLRRAEREGAVDVEPPLPEPPAPDPRNGPCPMQ